MPLYGRTAILAYSSLKRVKRLVNFSYIPTAGSGVTIATGLDLGQQSAPGLARLGVPSNLINRFRPYLGLKRRSDVHTRGLNEKNLKITFQEGRQIDVIFRNAQLARVQRYTG